ILLDTANRIVSVSGENITLTRKEYEILLYLLTHRRQVLTFEQIYNAVWKDVFIGDNSVIFFHVAQLRKKLGGNWIENVYGVGYRMRDPDMG
uniref:winged helix-turn-helix domain-containing protein n=1 Tax=Hungatella effluvii TaxID=1096246 RepID=UPI002A81B4C8